MLGISGSLILILLRFNILDGIFSLSDFCIKIALILKCSLISEGEFAIVIHDDVEK